MGEKSAEMCRVGVRIPMQDYKSLHKAVVIWTTLVNTQTHRIEWLYTISSPS